MNFPSFAFQHLDWSEIQATEFKGLEGVAWWKTVQLEGLRIRMIEYSVGYVADHWCQKGHIVHCLEGEFINENENGVTTIMKKGMSYIVSDGLSSHRSQSIHGAKLLIIDGDFLKPN